MRTVTYQNMTFKETITPRQIHMLVGQMAAQINANYVGRNPLFICVLKGAFAFASDLYRCITIPSNLTFVRLKSYTGTQSSGEVRELIGLDEDVREREVIVLEDIVDTGRSMDWFKRYLNNRGAKSIAVASFLFKPDALLFPESKPDYIGIEIPKKFVIGYGLDLDDEARNLDAIYELVP